MAFAVMLRARKTARILHALSDLELKDIGLSRSDIGCLARYPSDRESSPSPENTAG